MIINKLGTTNIHLSALGIGAWAIGGGGYKYGWGQQDDKDSIATIKRGLELGINWIDTAPVYGGGHSEIVVGQAIKGIRNKVILSTKCGLRMAENNEDIIFDLKKDNIVSEVEKSLKNLKTDVIDLYMIHKPVPEEDIEEAWDTIVDLVKIGKVRYAGVSSFSLEQLKRIHTIHPVAFLQTEYSMLERSIEPEILDYCARNGIGIVVYSPMASGLLTGIFSKERIANLPQDDWRLSEERYTEPYLSANLALVERLRPFASMHNRSIGQLALAWVLRRSEITSAIVGARRPSQIEETTLAGDWVLSEEEKKQIGKILAEHHASLKKLNTAVGS